MTMGEANRRGTFEQRKAAAPLKVPRLKLPADYPPCRWCGSSALPRKRVSCEQTREIGSEGDECWEQHPPSVVHLLCLVCKKYETLGEDA
jgi:hypothetical protein